jgi:hypothetical protein
MSADSVGGVGPVSVRYAAQIRELLYAQAVHRMAADQEAARATAQAERAARVEAIAKPEAAEPVKAKIDIAPEPKTDDTHTHLVDIQA